MDNYTLVKQFKNEMKEMSEAYLELTLEPIVDKIVSEKWTRYAYLHQDYYIIRPSLSSEKIKAIVTSIGNGLPTLYNLIPKSLYNAKKAEIDKRAMEKDLGSKVEIRIVCSPLFSKIVDKYYRLSSRQCLVIDKETFEAHKDRFILTDDVKLWDKAIAPKQ
jgi:hypothetical protein